MTGYLSNFNANAQHYGTFFAGFHWSIFGCGTFREKVGQDEASKRVKQYMRNLGLSIQARIPYIAVPEHRTSGCGHHAIPLHFHFVAGCPEQSVHSFLANSRRLWTGGIGNAKVDRYDPLRAGAFYLAKLANHQNFDFIFDNMDRITYQGPRDLLRAMDNSPYVPEHARGIPRVRTLVLRNAFTKLPVSSKHSMEETV